MTFHRRRGVAIVDTSKGILVVAGKNQRFMLPGGGANNGETRLNATIRELNEETGLRATSSKYLFNYIGRKWRGKNIRNFGKVFLIKAKGIPRPKHEIKHINYYSPDHPVDITSGTKLVISMYLKMKENNEL